jgi:hypothetical protein
MKKNIFVPVLMAWIVTLLPFTVFAGGGKPFEGVITYKIAYPDSKFTEAQLNMFPKLVTISIKGNKSRMEMNTMGSLQVSIVDYIEKVKIVLIDMMGQKYAIKSSAEDIEKENAKQPKGSVELTNETKVIAGYTCKKAIVTTVDDGVKTTFEVFYTTELGGKGLNFDDPVYKDIDGVLMEFTSPTPQKFSMKFTATSVEKKSINSKDFEIPVDYKLTTEEELKSKFGGAKEE